MITEFTLNPQLIKKVLDNKFDLSNLDNLYGLQWTSNLKYINREGFPNPDESFYPRLCDLDYICKNEGAILLERRPEIRNKISDFFRYGEVYTLNQLGNIFVLNKEYLLNDSLRTAIIFSGKDTIVEKLKEGYTSYYDREPHPIKLDAKLTISHVLPDN